MPHLSDDDLLTAWGEALQLARPKLSPLVLRHIVLECEVRWPETGEPHSMTPFRVDYAADGSMGVVLSSFTRHWYVGELRELLLSVIAAAHIYHSGEAKHDWHDLHPAYIQLCKHLGCDAGISVHAGQRWEHLQMHGASIERFISSDMTRCPVCERWLNSDDPPKAHSNCLYYVRSVLVPQMKQHIQQSNTQE